VTASNAIQINNVTYRYGERVAIDSLTQSIAANQLFAVLGPNGSGKSTLFRLISTLVPLQQGEIEVSGLSVSTQATKVRQRIGVVFQHPSLDRKLTVRENIDCQASLVGLTGSSRRSRVDEVISAMSLQDRTNERAEKLSGGLKRRVELAKGILHRPEVLLLDEPSTGFDPSARLELWNALQELKQQHGCTVVMTTHLLEEADKADAIAIMHRGKVVAQDAPDALRRAMGSNIVTIQSREPQAAQNRIREQFGWTSEILNHAVRVSSSDAANRLAELTQLLGDSIECLTVARPSLEDVFIAKTGENFE
jgi:ABC-2 type transport system ATP-binding protein